MVGAPSTWTAFGMQGFRYTDIRSCMLCSFEAAVQCVDSLLGSVHTLYPASPATTLKLLYVFRHHLVRHLSPSLPHPVIWMQLLGDVVHASAMVRLDALELSAVA